MSRQSASALDLWLWHGAGSARDEIVPESSAVHCPIIYPGNLSSYIVLWLSYEMFTGHMGCALQAGEWWYSSSYNYVKIDASMVGLDYSAV